ncbi:hypothetical protein V6N11_041447 [Hibiscus sabdariffa]|uniref:Myb/SANT-like domain-containing protein n=1 Tax=Hibiscus sabdariffa TaxID=183260 RepID=A0ABR2RKI3_9ROSI
MPWKVLEVEFQKRTSLGYDKNKLKNKWDWLKNRWSLWKALKGKETGLGWDHEKGTISASEEWWNKKFEENIHFQAFQDEGIEPELEHKMEQLFGVSVVQGILKFTPVMDCSQHASVGYNQYECVDEMTGSHKSAKVDSTRKIRGAALLTEKLDIMVKAITQRNKRDMELMKLEVHGDSSHSLADSLAKLSKVHDPAFNVIDKVPNFIPPEAISDVVPMQEEAQQLGTNAMTKVRNDITTSLMIARR